MVKESGEDSEAKIKPKKRNVMRPSKRRLREMEQDLANTSLQSQEMQGYYEQPCEPYAEKHYLTYTEKQKTDNDESNDEE